jgi:glycogen debranching enzyme
MLLNLVTAPSEPVLTFENQKVQPSLGVAYSRALDNLLRINVLPAGPGQLRSGLVSGADAKFVRAGGDYQDPWTRDASINSWNALSLLAPNLAQNTLWAVCERLPNGSVAIQDDNQWWDKIIWVSAAWNHYATTGDRAFLKQAYATSKQVADRLIATRFDKEFGLFQGPSHLQDGIAGYPAPFSDPPGSSGFILDHPGSDKLMTLSVNSLYFGAFRSLAKMAAELDENPAVAKAWLARTNDLRKAINQRLWMPKAGSYAYLLFGQGDLRGKQAEYQEATGISLAVLCGVADAKRAKQVVENARTTKFGIPLVDPEFERYAKEGPGRHSRIVWPLAQGYWADAAAKVGNVARFRTEVEILAGLAKSTDWNFYEIYNPTTGKPDGGMQCGGRWGSCSHQTWSASAYVRMIHYGLFGMGFTPSGISFSPTLPAEWGGVSLTGLRYRNSVINIRLSGSGRKVIGFSVDGKAKTKPFLPANLKGPHNVEIVMESAGR